MHRFKWPATAIAVYLLALALSGPSVSGGVAGNEAEMEAWNEFKRQFNKTYERSDEEQRRLEIFLDNKRYIESQNLKATPGSFEQGVNHLSDLTRDEVNESRCGFRLRESSASDFYDSDSRESAGGLLESILAAFNASQWEGPERDEQGADGAGGRQAAKYTRAWYENLLSQPELDYRELGIVSRVKDQGSCGSCWAFATTGALESVLAQRDRKVLLSEQQLVDCSRNYGNNGCQGGLMNAALRYVRDHGIMASRDYPYVGQDGRCKYQPRQVVSRVRGSAVLPRGHEGLLRVALALTGPIPVAIDAGARSFHHYKSGVYDDTVCRNSARSLNHAVLLVGYGSSKTAGDYWILKNSWGRSWGDNGYIKMARNRRNLCGVATFAVLPIV